MTIESFTSCYAQKEGIDYNEVFSPMVKHSSIRILLALVAQLDLELVQMDVKTAFLHGALEDEIYMVQLEGFKVTRKEHEVCSTNRQNAVSILLASQFKINDAMSLKNDAEMAYMEKALYANDVGSLMHAMICTRTYISHAIGTVSRSSQWVEGYCDSDNARNLDKRRYTKGYIFTLAKALMCWKSTLQSTNALSTTETKYMTITKAVKGEIWLQGLLGEL
nr:retrovirus-related Pol polyprotein from transposon TNT 1-94 [Tanacetum cinerariifolium]